jgi:IS4 transposase
MVMIGSSSEGEWSSLLSLVSEAIDLEASARSSGALLRRRRIGSAEALLRLCLVYGPGGQSLSDTATWAGLEGVADLSKTALLYRVRDSADWLTTIAAALLAKRSSAVAAAAQRTWFGRRVRLVDGSSITAPGQGQDWRLHAVYDLGGQRFDQLELTAKSQAEALQRMTAVAGDLIVADRVYARPEGLRHVRASGADFLVRLGRRSLRLQHADGTAFDLAASLRRSKAQGGVDCEVQILNASAKGWTPLPARLVIVPKPPDAAKSSRAKALRASQRGAHRNDPLSLEAAEHLMLVTSLTAEQASPDQLISAYRLRWQIELAFKRLKSLLQIDRLPAKEPGLAKAWLAAHLIAALLIEDIIPQLRDSSP